MKKHRFDVNTVTIRTDDYYQIKSTNCIIQATNLHYKVCNAVVAPLAIIAFLHVKRFTRL